MCVTMGGHSNSPLWLTADAGNVSLLLGERVLWKRLKDCMNEVADVLSIDRYTMVPDD